MPKMKTNRGAAKRFKLTAKGRVKHRSTGYNHILTKKAQKRKRQLRKTGMLCEADTVLAKKMLRKK
ncbi:MAG: 50S ribosomal protein L35 [Gammaproteobacteria bacterium]|nr:50S ribosomal protein L35 [Gammaproteobacteria bacterium]